MAAGLPLPFQSTHTAPGREEEGGGGRRKRRKDGKEEKERVREKGERREEGRDV